MKIRVTPLEGDPSLFREAIYEYVGGFLIVKEVLNKRDTIFPLETIEKVEYNHD